MATADRISAGVARAGQTVQASLDLVVHLLGNVERLVSGVTRDSAEVACEAERFAAMAQEQAAGLHRTIAAAPRFARIISEAARIVALYRLHAARTRTQLPEAAARSRSALHRDCARRLYQLCVELRGAVLKLGQFLSARPDLLPPEYIEELAALQDRVPPIPTEEIRARLEEELGRPVGELFAEFEDEPVAAASLAQVHGARLPDGTRVVVKVQLPGLERLIEIDLAALRIVASLLADLWPQLDWPTLTAELSRSVSHELDFRAEAQAASSFRAAFADDPRVVVPAVFGELSAVRVLTLERLDGQRLTDFLEGAAAADRDTVLTLLVGSYLRQMLGLGHFQADPHPGNFLVLPGPRLALLDFGAATELTSARRQGYQSLCLAFMAGDRARLGALLGELGFEARGGDPEALLEVAELLLEKLRPGVILAGAGLDPQAEMKRALALLRGRASFRVPADFVLIGRVFATLAGLLFRYRPGVPLYPLLAGALASARPASV
jgi:ubiquinone biosynthesis protein